jgi:aldose 1-epimerase
MSLTAEPFGVLPDGSPVIRYMLSRPNGLTLRVLTYGGVVQSLEVPDARGRADNVVLGFASLPEYLAATDPYFGALIGRFANRLAGGRFNLDDRSYAVGVNATGNCLHGGRTGFDRRLWQAEPLSDHELRLSLTSPDGDQGFPGRLNVEVTYTCWKAAFALTTRPARMHPP